MTPSACFCVVTAPSPEEELLTASWVSLLARGHLGGQLAALQVFIEWKSYL